jgi:uncharacterized membrane protein YfcA
MKSIDFRLRHKVPAMMLPVIAVGAAAGVFLLKRIPQRVFIVTVAVLAAAATITLLF